MHQRNTFLGILLVSLAFSGIVFETVLYRLFHEVNLGVILLERGLFGAMMVIITSFFMGKENGLSSFFNVPNKQLYVGRVILMVISAISMFFAGTMLPTITVNAYLLTTTLFIAPLAVLFLKEKFKVSTVIGILIGFSGVYMLQGGDYTTGSILGIAAALTCAVAEASLGILLKKMSNHDEPLLRVLFWGFVATMLCGAGMLFVNIDESLAFFKAQDVSDLYIVLGLSLLYIWQMFFFYKGYQKTDISRAEYGSFTMVPLSIAIGYLFFNDVIPTSFIIAISLLITGLLIVMLFGHEQHEGTELNE